MNERKPFITTKRKAVEYAIHSMRLSGFEFTSEELADFEKLARGEVTTDELREKLKSEIEKLRGEKPELFQDTK